MAAPREPIFLERQTYRRRRLIDAMRVVPVVGLVLFLVPLLGGGVAGRGTAAGGMFIFAVWLGLIVVAAALVRLLARAPGGVASDPLEPDANAAEAPPEAEIDGR
jgi:hypothetical protein